MLSNQIAKSTHLYIKNKYVKILINGIDSQA